MRYPDRATMCVSSPGRLRDGLPVLRDRPGRAAAQHVHRRDRRAGRGRCPVAGPRRGARRPGPGLQRRVHGHGRAAGQLQGGHRRRTPAHRPERPPGSACPPAASPSPRSGWCRGSASSPTRASPSPWRCRCTPPTTSCATSWCRSTPAGSVARGRRRGVELRAHDQAPGLDRVRHDARHQRPGLARRPARRRPALLRRLGLGAREPDPAQPDARLEVDRLRPGDEREFVRRLEAKGIPTTVRDTRGREIDGACGQLAAIESTQA